ncbi:RluA family pseudouridine synthase [Paenibacillus sp. IB182363]|uniref:RNA pseudouridylate synthase n=1 Tax=Paenibacillus oceani TaxID=2772510 RepID=A0A927CCR1_9BACL|nr:RluA family pseudouridine synthase [Paenibacillus oceani]
MDKKKRTPAKFTESKQAPASKPGKDQARRTAAKPAFGKPTAAAGTSGKQPKSAWGKPAPAAQSNEKQRKRTDAKATWDKQPSTSRPDGKPQKRAAAQSVWSKHPPAGDTAAGAKPHKNATPAKAPWSKHPPATELTVQQPDELLAFLIQSLSSHGRNAVKSILARGQVSVNGRTVTRHDQPLLPGHQVTVSWSKIVKADKMVGLSILHEDDDVIVVHKDAGLLSIASEQEKEMTAYRQLSDHVRRADPRSRIFIVHRLDRDTSGVMMFAKSEQIQQQLQNTWQESVLERTYVALVEGEVREEQGTIRSWLKENKAMRVYSSQKPDDGQLAVTRYKLMKSSKLFSLLEVELETGRKNQIRVHMQDIGHPVVGDKKYGASSGSIGRLGLHAHVLTFRHPATGQTMRFESKVPPAFLRVFRE